MAGTLEVPVEGNAVATEDPKVKAAIKRLNELLEGSNLIGEAGIGAAQVSAAKLATGAKELFPQLPAAAARRIIPGQISAAGAVVVGEGFTSEKTATGEYTIKITTELATVATATFTCVEQLFIPSISATTKKEVKVKLRNVSNVTADAAFHFFIFG